MKNYFLIVIILLLVSCSTSNRNNDNPFVGVWKGAVCHPFFSEKVGKNIQRSSPRMTIDDDNNIEILLQAVDRENGKEEKGILKGKGQLITPTDTKMILHWFGNTNHMLSNNMCDNNFGVSSPILSEKIFSATVTFDSNNDPINFIIYQFTSGIKTYVFIREDKIMEEYTLVYEKK